MTKLRYVAALAIAGALVGGPAEAVQRVFVSSSGNDSNVGTNCGFTAPCRGFTTAMTVVDPGGEVIALDAAGYGAVTITKSVNIIANPGFYAGITASSGNGITIATAGVNVLLRGLNINGIGGSTGISMTNGASLTIDNCVISNFTGSAVVIDTAGAKVRISNTVLSGNGNHGLLVSQGKVDVVGSRANGNTSGGFTALTTGSGNTATVTVTDSTASGNAYGFYAFGSATTSTAHVSLTRVAGTSNVLDGVRTEQGTGSTTAIVGNSTFTENGAYGMNNAGGTLRSLQNNVVDFNTTAATNGSITTVGGL
jgi:hypothetical protein